MRTFLLTADSQRLRLAEAADRFAEACLLCALRRRAVLDDLARYAVEQQHARSRGLARDLLRQDLEQAFGVSTLTLLEAQVVDGRADGDDARALISYNFPYELRPDRANRRWVLTLLDEGVPVIGGDGDQSRPLQCSWKLGERGEDAVVILWCAIADLAARWLANEKEQ
jgi:hypothetical protein